MVTMHFNIRYLKKGMQYRSVGGTRAFVFVSLARGTVGSSKGIHMVVVGCISHGHDVLYDNIHLYIVLFVNRLSTVVH